jgi:hypothetical protein
MSTFVVTTISTERLQQQNSSDSGTSGLASTGRDRGDDRPRFSKRPASVEVAVILLSDTSQPLDNDASGRADATRLVIGDVPRALVPIDHATIRPLVGTVTPRSLSGRSLIAQFLIDLTEPVVRLVRLKVKINFGP